MPRYKHAAKQPGLFTSLRSVRSDRTAQVLGILLIVFLPLLPSFIWAQEPYTHHAALVVQYGDGKVFTACVDLEPLQASDGEATGEEVLMASGVQVIAEHSAGLGSAVCKIGHDGCDFPNDSCFCKCTMRAGEVCTYWAYYHQQDGAWQYSGVGTSSYVVKPGSVEGWAWGEGGFGSGAQPPVMRFDEICIPPTPTDTPTSMPSPTLTSSPASTLTPTPTQTPTQTPTPTPTQTPTKTSAPTQTPTPMRTDTPTRTPTYTPTRTPTHTPTDTPVGQSTRVPLNQPSDTPMPTPTAIPIPTNTPLPVPTNVPSPVSTDTPVPTNTPTRIPPNTPILAPTDTPSPVQNAAATDIALSPVPSPVPLATGETIAVAQAQSDEVQNVVMPSGVPMETPVNLQQADRVLATTAQPERHAATEIDTPTGEARTSEGHSPSSDTTHVHDTSSAQNLLSVEYAVFGVLIVVLLGLFTWVQARNQS